MFANHGAGIGGVIDGFPAGIDIDTDFIQNELDRRRPGQSRITTGRNEGDKVEILSGVFAKVTGVRGPLEKPEGKKSWRTKLQEKTRKASAELEKEKAELAKEKSKKKK